MSPSSQAYGSPNMAQPSPGLSDWTASSASPMLIDEKHTFQESSYEASPDVFSSPHHVNSRIVRRLQHYDNIIGYVVSLFSVGLTAAMDGIMVYCLYIFYTTKDIAAPGRKGPWAKNTTLWPTLLLLVASLITLLLDSLAVIAACCRKSKKALRVENRLIRIGYVVFVVKWIIVFVLYRTGRTSKDMWGWSCDERAKKIQQYYVTQINFHAMCIEQVGGIPGCTQSTCANVSQSVAWYMSIAEMAIKVILMIAAFWLARKLKKLHR